jgi:hypothetical protein
MRSNHHLHFVRRRPLIGVIVSLAALGVIGLLIGTRSTPAKAQAQAQEFRVGNLIENGFLGEPQGWTLQGFRTEDGKNITLKGQGTGRGTARTVFKGPKGFYTIRIKYFDESDGVSKASLAIGQREIGSWSFDGIIVNAFRWQEFDGVAIDSGEEIVLSGSAGGYEYCRLVGVEILPSQAPAQAGETIAVARKEYSKHLVPLDPSAANGPEYLLAPEPYFSGGEGTYWLYLKAGQQLRLTAWPIATFYDTTLQYSLTQVGAAKPLVAETLTGNSSHPIRLSLRAEAQGLYELQIAPAPGAKGGVKIDYDVPGVTGLPASGAGYFFVPRGTVALSITTSGHAVLLDATNRVMLDEQFGKKTTRIVKVPAGSDGQPWYFQGKLEQLDGVPPYVAARREALLAPAETF